MDTSSSRELSAAPACERSSTEKEKYPLSSERACGPPEPESVTVAAPTGDPLLLSAIQPSMATSAAPAGWAWTTRSARVSVVLLLLLLLLRPGIGRTKDSASPARRIAMSTRRVAGAERKECIPGMRPPIVPFTGVVIPAPSYKVECGQVYVTHTNITSMRMQ